MATDENKPDVQPPEGTVPCSPGRADRDSTSDHQHGRFLPGTRFGKRYRIVGLLGKGGMGEVYRADDLELGQSVALKFLPRKRWHDSADLDRLRGEVRAARQVSHPNVCRVYDIGEVDGFHFISMEYVDGEDLASVLRRLGRPSQDKALQIARQLCAGLAAAHERGVLHRDLKPANIMIDGHGRVRIMDFGLAARAQETLAASGAPAGAVGTLAYMPSEILAGREATVQSDIYSLGLVLYEVYTGKRAYDAQSVAELKRLQEDSSPSQPSHLVASIDPAVERAILHCLEQDPAERPPSVLALATALPGGDPLAAAVAAGETPSPEMVAAAGGRGGLSPTAAMACLLAIVAGVLLVAELNDQTALFRLASPEKSPAVLADRAREILADLGHETRPGDSAHGYRANEAYIEYLGGNVLSPNRWQKFGVDDPPGYLFWYRESPIPLIPGRPFTLVKPDVPARGLSGEALVVLDDGGKLRWLEIVPPEKSEESAATSTANWSGLFAAAGLDLDSTFKRTAPVWSPLVATDSLLAWKQVRLLPDRQPLHIAAGTWRGRPVYFRVVDDFAAPERTPDPSTSGTAVSIMEGTFVTLMLIGLLLTGFFARRNLRSGRGDRRGALRLGIFSFVMILLSWVLAVHGPLAYIIAFDPFLMALGVVVLFSGWFALAYLALEPAARRRWPGMLIAWTRLLSGRVRDPRVGRDVLLGALAGIGLYLTLQIPIVMATWLDLTPPRPLMPVESVLPGGSMVLARLVDLRFLGWTIFHVFVLLLLWALLRKRWLAAGIYLIYMTTVNFLLSYSPLSWPDLLPGLVFALLSSVLWYLLVVRGGLLTAVAALYFTSLLGDMPLTLDGSAWYTGTSTLVFLVLGLIAGYAAHIAMSGHARAMAGDGSLQSPS